MDSTNKDEIITNFMAVTQCSNEEATRYLEAAQWNAQTAMEIFFDDGTGHAGGSSTGSNTQTTGMNVNQGPSASGGTGGYESDDESPMQAIIDESIRTSAAASKATESKGGKSSTTSSRFGTIGSLRQEEEKQESSDEEGQAYYAGGSERSGQQIIGPPKPKDVDKKVTKLFEAARKQGAIEANEEEDNSSAQRKKEKVFSGVGYTLGDEKTPSRQSGLSNEATGASASNRAEQVPLRFFSNGFTVGDGELRKFEENQEFMNYIKRGEVPPELRNLTAGGRQVEVRLEDHRNEEYKPVAPQFKAFGGTGHMLGSPAPTVTQSKSAADNPFQSSRTTASSATSTSTDLGNLEKLAEQQLKTSSSSTVIRLRLPDISTPIRIVIDLNRRLSDVRKFLNQNVPSLQSNQFQFLEPPATRIKPEDEDKTISEAKLSNATLAIRRSS